MKKNILYFLPLLFFFIDILLLGLFQQEIVSTLLCFYAVWLMQTNKKNLLLLSLFFLSSIDLILYGNFFFPLIYLIPLTILTLQAKKMLNKTFWLPYAFVATSIFAADFLLKPWLLHFSPNPLFTGAKLCVNLVLILIIEKLERWSRQSLVLIAQEESPDSRRIRCRRRAINCGGSNPMESATENNRQFVQDW